ncbi:MAG: hypothetical protein QM627_10210 [Luteolibacter sp.]
MKKPVSPHTAVFLILCAASPLLAQNLATSDPLSEVRLLKIDDLEGTDSARFEEKDVLAAGKAPSRLKESAPAYCAQDIRTLDLKTRSNPSVDAVVDLAPLNKPSVYKKVYVSAAKGQPYVVSETALEDGLAHISAVYRGAGEPASASDCPSVGLSVEKRIKLEPSRLLEVVAQEIGANPTCACEVVKAAIRTVDADTRTVVAIVETAANASPESLRIVSQCAIAEMPEALADIQTLMARLDPNAGDSGASSKSGKEPIASAKSAKDSKAVVIEKPVLPNPLDRPPPFPFLPPPPVIVVPVTDVDPL